MNMHQNRYHGTKRIVWHRIWSLRPDPFPHTPETPILGRGGFGCVVELFHTAVTPCFRYSCLGRIVEPSSVAVYCNTRRPFFEL